MLKKQRNLVWFIFILGILFIAILLHYVPERARYTSKLARIHALLFTKIPSQLARTSDYVKTQEQQTKWIKPSKPSQRKHRTNKSVIKNVQIKKDNHYVHSIHSSFPTLPNSKRLYHKFAVTSNVGVRASTPHLRSTDVHLRAIPTRLCETALPFRANPTHLRSNPPKNRTRKAKSRARSSEIRVGLVQSPRVNVPNYSVSSVRGMSYLKADVKSSPFGATSHCHSELKTYQTISRPVRIKTHKTTPSVNQRSRVVILAHGRSGSSFLGGIFNAHPDIFFIYEPLLTLQKYIMNISSVGYLNNVEEVLHSILNCNFKDNQYLKYLSNFDRHRSMSSPLVSPPLCNVSQYEASNFQQHRKWRRCVKNISAHVLNNRCREKRHVVIKILATRLKTANFSWFLRVSSTSSSPVRILYLVRDPRAMHFSRYKIGWIAPRAQRKESLENGLADSKVKKICDSIEQHLRSISQHADHIHVIRYEDLATNPEVFISCLFTSLGIRPSEDVSRWLQEKTHAQVKRINFFSLFRETKTVVTAWQKNIPIKLVGIVEERCHGIMKYLGYLLTNGSKTVLRNIEKPLFSDKWKTLQL